MERNGDKLQGGSYIRPFVIEGVMTSEAREVRIIDGSYIEKFRLPDGGHISIDGEIYQVRYVDETHFAIGSKYWHICQFGELVVDKGHDVQKVENVQA
jgi:hypothetical protein